jgi:regulator of protease activity HflC (stomatin/prohibitin superfamily)
MARNIGGPLLLIVFDGSALYLERGNRFSRVVGPGASFLERHETIKYPLDLRAKSKTDSISVWTKDGIFIKLTICIEYQIGDPQKISTKPQLLHPCDHMAVKKAIERYSLRWPDPTKEPGEFTWEDATWGQITGIIPDYIGSRFLDDLLIADRNSGQILSPNAVTELFGKLNSATKGFGVYVTDFQITSIEVPPEVEECYVQYWEAEGQSRTMIMEGSANAQDIRAHEKMMARAQHDLILAIADGLRRTENGRLNEALLLSLSEVLDHSLNDPYMRSLTSTETMDTLEKIRIMLL